MDTATATILAEKHIMDFLRAHKINTAEAALKAIREYLAAHQPESCATAGQRIVRQANLNLVRYFMAGGGVY